MCNVVPFIDSVVYDEDFTSYAKDTAKKDDLKDFPWKLSTGKLFKASVCLAIELLIWLKYTLWRYFS